MARHHEGIVPKVDGRYRHFRLSLKTPYLPIGIELEFDY